MESLMFLRVVMI